MTRENKKKTRWEVPTHSPSEALSAEFVQIQDLSVPAETKNQKFKTIQYSSLHLIERVQLHASHLLEDRSDDDGNGHGSEKRLVAHDHDQDRNSCA